MTPLPRHSQRYSRRRKSELPEHNGAFPEALAYRIGNVGSRVTFESHGEDLAQWIAASASNLECDGPKLVEPCGEASFERSSCVLVLVSHASQHRERPLRAGGLDGGKRIIDDARGIVEHLLQ